MQSARQSARTFRDGWPPFGIGTQVAYAVTAVPLVAKLRRAPLSTSREMTLIRLIHSFDTQWNRPA
jgi:hypothetical protein